MLISFNSILNIEFDKFGPCLSGSEADRPLAVLVHLYYSYLYIQILKLIFDVFYCETKNLFELKFQNFPQNKFIVNQR